MPRCWNIKLWSA